jgi:hypothetical protein
MTDEVLLTQFIALGTVLDTEVFISSMNVTVAWDTPSIPQTLDVNDVEVLSRVSRP